MLWTALICPRHPPTDSLIGIWAPLLDIPVPTKSWTCVSTAALTIIPESSTLKHRTATSGEWLCPVFMGVGIYLHTGTLDGLRSLATRRIYQRRQQMLVTVEGLNTHFKAIMLLGRYKATLVPATIPLISTEMQKALPIRSGFDFQVRLRSTYKRVPCQSLARAIYVRIWLLHCLQEMM